MGVAASWQPEASSSGLRTTGSLERGEGRARGQVAWESREQLREWGSGGWQGDGGKDGDDELQLQWRRRRAPAPLFPSLSFSLSLLLILPCCSRWRQFFPPVRSCLRALPLVRSRPAKISQPAARPPPRRLARLRAASSPPRSPPRRLFPPRRRRRLGARLPPRPRNHPPPSD